MYVRKDSARTQEIRMQESFKESRRDSFFDGIFTITALIISIAVIVALFQLPAMKTDLRADYSAPKHRTVKIFSSKGISRGTAKYYR